MDIQKTGRNTPTLRQIKALQFLKQGNSVRKSMILAGYSIKTANKGTSLLKFKNAQNTLLAMKEIVVKKGMTAEKMADKLVEWIDAEEPVINRKTGEIDGYVKDSATQIKAYDRWKHLVEKSEETPIGGQLKRKLTIEEFISEPPKEEIASE